MYQKNGCLGKETVDVIANILRYTTELAIVGPLIGVKIPHNTQTFARIILLYLSQKKANSTQKTKLHKFEVVNLSNTLPKFNKHFDQNRT